MVSGIGPSATLERFGIPIVSKSEGVGQGMWVREALQKSCFVLLYLIILQDQPFYGVTYKVNVTTNSQLLVNPPFLYQAREDYLTAQTGPLDSPGGNWVGKSIFP